MIITKSKKELNSFLKKERKNSQSIGFVPTMGALHQGHLKLVKQCVKENDISVCSIFVNPTQFNNPEDLTKYPRQLQVDINLLESVNCDYLFAPDVNEMYPADEDKIDFNFGKLELVMEGANRPGHFQGVATIVKKLFEIVNPHKAYFGKKDFQQLLIIKSLTQQFNLSPEIIGCDIVREEDGLAMSSRNQRLSPAQRKEAPFIYKTLKESKTKTNDYSVEDVKQWVTEEINSNPFMEIEYFEVTNSKDLQPISNWNDSDETMGFIVVNMGDVRLIDNIQLT
jgi:pantoate--beta-alanine ligase